MSKQVQSYPGYTLVRREESPLFHGVATTLTHDVSGATVLLVENEDENKAFGIGFGTFPCDDTGVFHILEHSVLAGSEKYPVTSPFMQLVKSSMASFLNAMTFPDKTVYPFATPNEADFRNLMDVYLNAVFCPLAVQERSVFEQEGWHREADGRFSGVVYNEMQGALAAPEARLDAAMDAALFPDNGYGFVSGGDPASIPGLTYEQYVKIYRRHYRPDNCCITLYGKMDMGDKLAFLDRAYLSRMPKGAPRPRTPLQYPQAGIKKEAVYETETPESIPVQCALGWYTGRFEEMEKQTAVNILLDALLSTNQSPLKKYLLEQDLGADIDVAFDGSVQQPVLELVLKGTDRERAARFAPAVRAGVEQIVAAGIPAELLTASINHYEFQVTERPGSLPDGVLAAIEAVTGWLHTGDPMADLRPEPVFAFLRGKLGTRWYDALLAELFGPEPVEVTLASEFRYCNPIVSERTLALVISQSGETSDTLAALKLAKSRGVPVLAIVNVVGSSIARAADYVLYTYAGPEIAVASTKAYMVQMCVLYLFALRLAYARGKLSEAETRRYTAELQRAPEVVRPRLDDCEYIKYLASLFVNTQSCFFIGRGFDYALSLEGSLKLKEISYVHSDAYAAGELKHGTISLVTDGVPVIALATQRAVYEKTLSNAKETKSRGGKVLLFTTKDAVVPEGIADYVVRLDEYEDLFMPLQLIVPLQLFAYYMAVLRGCDVDKPRNLAKSVTVE